MAHKLRGAAAAIKIDLFPFKRPPHYASFMRWLGRSIARTSALAQIDACRGPRYLALLTSDFLREDDIGPGQCSTD